MKYIITCEPWTPLGSGEMSWKKGEVRWVSNFYFYLEFPDGQVMLCTHSTNLVSLINSAVSRLAMTEQGGVAAKITRINSIKGEAATAPSDKLKGKVVLTIRKEL